jgi:hypothetical protein
MNNQYFDNKDLFMEPQVTQYGSHMVMTNVQRSLKHKYLNIDTRFCDEYNYHNTENYDSNYNDNNSAKALYAKTAEYTITLPERLTEVKSLSIKNIEVPLSIYNISANRGNNYFQVIDNNSSVSYMVTLPDAQYSAASLASTINGIFTSTTGLTNMGYSLDNSNNSQFYCFVNNSLSPPTNISYTIKFSVTPNGTFDKYNFKSKLGWLLGYRNTSYLLTLSPYTSVYLYTDSNGYQFFNFRSAKLTSEAFIDLNGPRYLYLAIDELCMGKQNSFVLPLPTSLINKNIIAKVTMLNNSIYQFGTILPANTYDGYLMSDKRTYTGKVNLQKLLVKLLDEYGNPVDLNGMDFSFCLNVEHE